MNRRAAFLLNPYTGNLGYRMLGAVDAVRIAGPSPVLADWVGGGISEALRQSTRLTASTFQIEFHSDDARKHPTFDHATMRDVIDPETLRIRVRGQVYVAAGSDAERACSQAARAVDDVVWTTRLVPCSKRERRRLARLGRPRRMGCRRIGRERRVPMLDLPMLLAIRAGKYVSEIAELLGMK